MQTFIETEVLAGLKKGSLESFSESVAEAASQELGEEVSIFATHKDHAFGVAGERVVRVTWEHVEGGAKVSVKDAKVSVITEENVDSFVARKLTEAVASVMKDGDSEDSRNRLRVLVGHLLPRGRYWVSDGKRLAESVLGEAPPWLAQYNESKKAVRKAVHGVLGETEKQVTKTPYFKIPSKRLGEFESELRESLAQMSALLNRLPDQVKGLKFEDDEAEGIDLPATRDAIVSESATLEEAVGIVLRFLRTEDLSTAAEVHDNLAERLRPMLVVGKFLSRMSDSQQSGEEDASSS